MKLLLDIERTVLTGRAMYWKTNRRGYTTSIEDAGAYTDDEASELVAQDIEGLTVSIDTKKITALLPDPNEHH